METEKPRSCPLDRQEKPFKHIQTFLSDRRQNEATILGGNPMSWTAATPHAFGLHLPFPWYSRGPVRQAALLELKTVVVLRNYEHPDSIVWEFCQVHLIDI